nr:hypothetical protein [Tanacetum cinerariifolium]
MQAHKESKKTSRRQPGNKGSSEGTCRIPGVPMSPQSSLLPHMKGLDKDGDLDDEGDDHISDIQDTDDEDAKTEYDEDEIYKYKICVPKDDDEEMLNAKVEDFEKSDAKIFDAAKADVKKIEEVKDDAKKTELPPKISSLSVSSGFGDQFLKLSSITSLISTVKDTSDVEINSLLDIKIQYEVPYIQSLSILRVLVSR